MWSWCSRGELTARLVPRARTGATLQGVGGGPVCDVHAPRARASAHRARSFRWWLSDRAACLCLKRGRAQRTCGRLYPFPLRVARAGMPRTAACARSVRRAHRAPPSPCRSGAVPNARHEPRNASLSAPASFVLAIRHHRINGAASLRSRQALSSEGRNRCVDARSAHRRRLTR